MESSISNIWYLLALCAPTLLGIGVALGFFSYFKNNLQQQITTWFLLSMLLIDLASRYAWLATDNNLYFLSLSALFEFSFFSILYYRFLLIEKPKWILFSIIGIALYLLIQVISQSIVTDVNQFQLYDRFLADGGILILGLLYLKDILTSDAAIPQKNKIMNTIIMLYLVVDLFMSLTINFMVTANVSLVFFFWITRLLFLLLLYLNLVYSIWQNGNKKKLKHYGSQQG